MHSRLWRTVLWGVLALAPYAWAQKAGSCADLMHFKAPGVEISKAASIEAGTTVPNQWGPGHSAPLPAYCRVEGVINRRTGVGGEEFGINFALAMPEKWNGDFLMQGGGGGNGVVMPPLGLTAAGDTPALMRGFAVVSTDTGHKSHRGPFRLRLHERPAGVPGFRISRQRRGRYAGRTIDCTALRKAGILFVLFGMLDRRPRRNDSVAALSDEF